MSDDITALAKLRLEELLAFFGINTKAKVVEGDGSVELRVDADPSGRLIGHHGEVLRSIQHLVNAMVRAKTTERVFVSVDIAGYKQARFELAEAKAREAAEQVLSSGQPQTLPPMSAAERRAVHVILAEMPGIVTESAGSEPNRQVVVKKNSNA